MRWLPAVHLSELPEGSMQKWGELVLFNHKGEVRALSGVCPHLNGPLAQGNFVDGVVVCPWHAWEFDTATGVCTHNAHAAVARYRVEVRDGVVYVEAPEADA